MSGVSVPHRLPLDEKMRVINVSQWRKEGGASAGQKFYTLTENWMLMILKSTKACWYPSYSNYQVYTESKNRCREGCNCTLPSVSTINLVPWFIYDGDRYDVDVFQGQVGPPVVPELMPNTKVDFTQPVWSGVISHHARKYLCHIPKVSLNGALTDFCFICFQLSHTHMVQKIWIYGMGSSMSVRSRENVRQAYNCSHLFHKVVTEQA